LEDYIAKELAALSSTIDDDEATDDERKERGAFLSELENDFFSLVGSPPGAVEN